MTILSRLSSRGASDTSWAVLEQGAALAASILSFMLLGRYLAAAGYGAFVGLYALMGPFLAFTQSGIVLAILEHAVRDREAPARVAHSCFSLTALNALICVPFVAVLAARSIGGIPLPTVLAFLVLEFVVNGVVLACGALIQALEGFGPASRLRTTTALSKAGLLTGLAGTGVLSLSTFAASQTVVLSVVMLAAITRVGKLGVTARLGRIEARHLRSTFLYGLGIAASVTQNDGDKFILNAAHHQADAGRYGLAYRLIQVAMLPLSAVTSATHVSFLYQREDGRTQMARAVRLSLVTLPYALTAAVALALMAPFIPKLLTSDFEVTSQIVPMLTPVILLRGLGAFPMNAIMGLGRNDLRTRILIVNALFALSMYAVLIPRYSWKGALAATLVSETSLFASAWIILALTERRRRHRAARAGSAQLASGAPADRPHV